MIKKEKYSDNGRIKNHAVDDYSEGLEQIKGSFKCLTKDAILQPIHI